MYKVGDKVCAVEDMVWLVDGCVVGTLGVVRGVDFTWVFVEWNDCQRNERDDELDGAWAMYPRQIALVERTTAGVIVASGAVVLNRGSVYPAIIVGDKRLDEVLRQYADSGEDVEIVVRRKERG